MNENRNYWYNRYIPGTTGPLSLDGMTLALLAL